VRFDLALRERVHNPSFWAHIEMVNSLLQSLCAALGFLEGDEATHSSVYASFLAVLVSAHAAPASTLELLGIASTDELVASVLSRFASIYSPTHALSFVTDPLFFDMRHRLVQRYGASFVQLGQGSIREQCHAALNLLGRDDQARATLRDEFTVWIAASGDTMESMRDGKQLKPHIIWSMVDDSSFQSLAPLLVQLHATPAGAVAGERNHKSTKRVFSSTRTRMSEAKLERQVAVSFNGHQLGRKLSVKRVGKYINYLADLCTNDTTPSVAPAEVAMAPDESLEDYDAGEFPIVEDPAALLPEFLNEIDWDLGDATGAS